MSRVEIDVIAHDRASRTMDNIADSTDDAAASLKGMGEEAKSIDGEINRLQGSLAKLREEIAKAPDDRALRRQYNVDRRSLNFLEKIKADAEKAAKVGVEIGEQAGKGVSRGLSDTLAVLPAQLRGAAIVAGGGMAAAMAPVIGATIGGAVLGGVGAGGIIGGVALAAKHPAIQAAAKEVGQELVAGLSDAAEPFQRPLLDSLESLRATGAAVTGDLHKDFTSLAPVLKPLTDGASGFAFEIGPGLSRAIEASKPALRVIGQELPKIGAAAGRALGEIADSSDGGVMALSRLLQTTEKFIIVGGQMIAMAEAGYEGMNRFTASFAENAETVYRWASIVLPPAIILRELWGQVADDANGSIEGMKRGESAAGDWAGALNGLASETDEATRQVQAFSDAIDEAFGNQMSQDEALIRYREGLAKVKEELKDGAKTLSLNSKEGRENRQALLDQLDAIERLRVANIANKMDVDEANQAYGEQVLALQAMAQGAGFSKTALDELFGPYAGKVFGTALEISTPGLAEALRRLREMRRLLGDDIYRTTVIHDDSHRAGEGRAAGGPAKPGVTYRVTEEGRPELLLLGTQGQVYSASQTAAMMSGSSGGASAGQAAATTSVWSAAQMAQVLQMAMQASMHGMSVVLDGREVGRMEARDAYHYSRGG